MYLCVVYLRVVKIYKYLLVKAFIDLSHHVYNHPRPTLSPSRRALDIQDTKETATSMREHPIGL